VFASAPTEPPSSDPQKESISVEITDTSITVENVSFILDACQSILFNFLIYSVFHPSSELSPCQIFPEKTLTQEQEPDSPLSNPVGVESDLVAIDTQTINSPVPHTTDGKKVICPLLLQ